MTSESPNRATAFIAAFNDIEYFLRNTLNAKKSDGFTWMVNLAGKKRILTPSQVDDLKEYADLRNAISHGAYENFRPIAEPLAETVSKIEHIRNSLLSPTLAIDVVGNRQIVTVSPEDDIRSPLEAIREQGISQFPVYEGKQCVGVLTTNAIARWVAADLREDDHLDAKTVGEALRYSEIQDEAVFVSRSTTATEVIAALTTPRGDGTLPRLAIITEHGQSSQRPLAVVTPSDFPLLLDDFAADME